MSQFSLPKSNLSDPAWYHLLQDFGVWNASYVLVACEGNWAGATNQNALGSVASIGPEGACCPADPIVNTYLLLSVSVNLGSYS